MSLSKIAVIAGKTQKHNDLEQEVLPNFYCYGIYDLDIRDGNFPPVNTCSTF